MTPLSWTYRPQQQVDIELDVTSYAGSDGKSVDPLRGAVRDIYRRSDARDRRIEAGRVQPDGREAEGRPVGSGKIHLYGGCAEKYRAYASRHGQCAEKDGTLLDNGGSVDPAGERKRLPFTYRRSGKCR